MSVLKMKSVTIVGRTEDLDRVCAEYISGREIHLENAASVLKDKGLLQPYLEDGSCYGDAFPCIRSDALTERIDQACRYKRHKNRKQGS